MTKQRFIKWAALVTVILLALLIGHMVSLARSAPVVRHASLTLADWPKGQPPVRIALVSDIHIAGPDMPPSHLDRVVARINGLRPDIVLLAGDFLSDKKTTTRRYTPEEATAPLGALHAPLGAVAVLGNHDYWVDAAAIRTALRHRGITVLANTAVQRGPLAIGGVDDDVTGHADLPRVARALAALKGAKLVLSHSPDVFPDLPATIGLTVAGHTHCGQIALPGLGPLITHSRYGQRYACGLIREGHKALIVTAGLGTSMLPLRLGAPPDFWLITVGPAGAATKG
ncbi:metallophosphoesterase [Pedomonas mirosovicensis]|uniref:metallophosphoesterase n=1 Tax=Pedomonas mirosovicensis TaxID=2908641 RepID=UPI002168D8D8|nr:metallophosphoesterase [Pedomonas mirosovicensis]MCH8685160.1 metallophosphoesterase [Pedomonas mirosovicensis]